jgi:hypothetical protein
MHNVVMLSTSMLISFIHRSILSIVKLNVILESVIVLTVGILSEVGLRIVMLSAIILCLLVI